MAKGQLFERIWLKIKRIPSGKVTTYGEIAKVLGIKNSRVIGWALHSNRDLAVPCHRVVNREGDLALGYAFGGWQKQREKLLQEGIEFISQRRVNLKKHRFTLKKG